MCEMRAVNWVPKVSLKLYGVGCILERHGPISRGALSPVQHHHRRELSYIV